MTKLCVVYETYFHLKLNAVVAYLAYKHTFRAVLVLKRSRQSRILLIKYTFIFCVALGVVFVVT